MNMAHVCWEENSNIQRIKYERLNQNEDALRMKDAPRGIYQCCDSNLNFSTATCSEDDCEYGTFKKSKVARQDPMSHRIIEKRRRDRMNNCLADLSRLIPAEYLKKGRGRIEKTEIIEMAIKHMKHLQDQERVDPAEQYRLGYQECMSEAIRFMVEIEGHFPREPVCARLLSHLQAHCDQGPHTGAAPIPRSPPSPRPVPCDYTVPKTEPENSNSSDAFVVATARAQEPQNGASYKYKNSIKLRFSQDASAHEVPKRQRMDERHEAPVPAVFDSHSSDHSPPPMPDPNSRSTDDDRPRSRPSSDCASPTGAPQTRHGVPLRRFSDLRTSPFTGDNFEVPLFALHAKGSYYVPLTIDYKTVLPFLRGGDLLDATPAPALHPVTISVSFLSHSKPPRYKYECNNNWH
ncbi:transcription factor cwo isoform X2 [Sitophilus oryzae]|uniref:Transcription factor cwo isoform X2 n=1 Tax=Sitophilus oryzae TaxID=7048 RepID=A0A6J2YDY8_SITOR|nr:transcription factor cwo isoform X2 [Sitophilus oryzae]